MLFPLPPAVTSAKNDQLETSKKIPNLKEWTKRKSVAN